MDVAINERTKKLSAIEGELEIKCTRCKTTVALTFKKNEAQLVLGEKKISYIVKTR